VAFGGDDRRDRVFPVLAELEVTSVECGFAVEETDAGDGEFAVGVLPAAGVGHQGAADDLPGAGAGAIEALFDDDYIPAG
jgi:hypothetical protein